MQKHKINIRIYISTQVVSISVQYGNVSKYYICTSYSKELMDVAHPIGK